jgi:hypothetical protein
MTGAAPKFKCAREAVKSGGVLALSFDVGRWTLSVERLLPRLNIGRWALGVRRLSS